MMTFQFTVRTLLIHPISLLILIFLLLSCSDAVQQVTSHDELRAPENLVASPGRLNVTLDWEIADQNTTQSQYSIYWANDPDFTIRHANRIVGVSPPFTHTNLSLDSTYYYRVTTITNSAESATSNQVNARPSDYPLIPTIQTVTASDSEIRLAWPKSERAEHFTIYWTNTPEINKTNANKILNLTFDQSADTVTYIHDSVLNGITYYYSISAANFIGESGLSEVVGVTPVELVTAPETAPNPVATAGNATVHLQWVAVPGAQWYIIDWVSNETTGQITSTVNFIDHSGLINDQIYFYNVTAANSAGNGPTSVQISAIPKIPIVAPQTAPVLSVQAGDGNITIDWTTVSGADNYRLDWFTDVSSGMETVLQPPFQHTQLTNGSIYHYTTVAMNQAGEGPASNEAMATPVNEWGALLDTAFYDTANSMALDSAANSYITGYTYADFNNTGKTTTDADVLFIKIDNLGALQWIREFGSTTSADHGNEVLVHSNGFIYVAGITYGDITDTGLTPGNNDLFLAKYDQNGTQQWIKQFDHGFDTPVSIAQNNLGNIVIAGGSPSFIATYDPQSGNELNFTSGLISGSIIDMVVTADGSIYLTGNSGMFAAKFAADLSLIWNTSTLWGDFAEGIAVDNNGNVYLSGTQRIITDQNGNVIEWSKIAVGKLNSSGTPVWSRILDSGNRDQGGEITVDENGDIFVTGYTQGNLANLPFKQANSNDIFVARFNTNSDVPQSIKQYNSGGSDLPRQIVIRNSAVYIGGLSSGDFTGLGKPGSDYGAFVIKRAK